MAETEKIVIDKKTTEEEKMSIYFRIAKDDLNRKSHERLVNMIIKKMTISELGEYVNTNVKHYITKDRIVFEPEVHHHPELKEDENNKK